MSENDVYKSPAWAWNADWDPDNHPSADPQMARLRANVVELIRHFAHANHLGFAECRVFYSPQEWAERGELYGTGSLLVVVYDGASIGDAIEYDRCNYGLIKKLADELSEYGMFITPCTCWYAAIHYEAKYATRSFEEKT